MRRDRWVYAGAPQDQIARAIFLGLRRYLSTHGVLVDAYLDFLFFAASIDLGSRSLGELGEDGEGFYFELSEEGKRMARHLGMRGRGG
jgi:hypothetical protein